MITSLEDTLTLLDEYELPEDFKLDKPPHHGDEKKEDNVPALLERYERLREGYLKSQITHGALEHLKTHGWDTLPSDGSEDLPTLEENHRQITRSLEETAQQMISVQQELQTDYRLLQHRKEELRELLHDFQCKGTMDDNDYSFSSEFQNSLLAQDDEEFDEETIQRGLAEQEELMLTLHKRKAELQSNLEALQKEAVAIGKENMKLDAKLASKEETEVLEKENERLQQQLNQLCTIKSEYSHRRLLLEELSGIKIESIEEEKIKEDHVLVHVKLLLLQKYKLQATLESHHRQRIRIVNAEFVSDSNEENLYLPPLNDLIPSAQDFCPGILQPHNQSNQSAGFRFLVHQALGRLETYKMRHEEVLQLREFCRVEVCRNKSDPEDHLFQKVVCVMPWKNTEVTAVLRVTPDCPCVPGSIFVESISCPQETLSHFQSRLQSEQGEYSSALKLAKYIQEALDSGEWAKPVNAPTEMMS